MDEIIMSPNFGGLCLVLLIVIGIIYGIILVIEEKHENDFDPVLEAKCKKCICYKVCRNHGCDYDCHDFMTEEMLQKKGLRK